MQLEGKTVLITGGSLGIGFGIARRFAEEGAKVAINGRNQTDLDASVQTLKQEGLEVIGLSGDVSIAKSVNDIFDSILDRWQQIDIVVSNAGICRPSSFLEISESEWDQHMSVNLKSAFLVGQRAAKEMIERGTKGSIINVSSVNGIAAEAGQAHYNTSKGGMNLLTMSMALELAPYGIRANALCPGFIQSRLTQPLIDQPNAMQEMLRSIPLGRVGEAEEVADCAVFLASNASRYMTGHCMVVDGGQLIKLS